MGTGQHHTCAASWRWGQTLNPESPGSAESRCSPGCGQPWVWAALSDLATALPTWRWAQPGGKHPGQGLGSWPLRATCGFHHLPPLSHAPWPGSSGSRKNEILWLPSSRPGICLGLRPEALTWAPLSRAQRQPPRGSLVTSGSLRFLAAVTTRVPPQQEGSRASGTCWSQVLPQHPAQSSQRGAKAPTPLSDADGQWQLRGGRIGRSLESKCLVLALAPHPSSGRSSRQGGDPQGPSATPPRPPPGSDPLSIKRGGRTSCLWGPSSSRAPWAGTTTRRRSAGSGALGPHHLSLPEGAPGTRGWTALVS